MWKLGWHTKLRQCESWHKCGMRDINANETTTGLQILHPVTSKLLVGLGIGPMKDWNIGFEGMSTQIEWPLFTPILPIPEALETSTNVAMSMNHGHILTDWGALFRGNVPISKKWQTNLAFGSEMGSHWSHRESVWGRYLLYLFRERHCLWPCTFTFGGLCYCKGLLVWPDLQFHSHYLLM